MPSSNHSFLKTLSILIGIMGVFVGGSWVLANEIYLKKVEYQKDQEKKARIEVKTTETLKQVQVEMVRNREQRTEDKQTFQKQIEKNDKKLEENTSTLNRYLRRVRVGRDLR